MKKLLPTILFLISFLGFSQEKFEESSVLDFQKQLVSEYADSLKSPLMAKDLKEFKTLDFFPANAEFFVIARFIKSKKEKPFKMKTSTERTPMYVKYGELVFTLEGKECKLNVYQNIELSKKFGFNDYLFLPFSDLTCGKESYIGGRYIDVRIPEGDTMAIDFNKAYNPYCAYNYKYSCPIVPLENDLDIAIQAGVKKFHD